MRTQLNTEKLKIEAQLMGGGGGEPEIFDARVQPRMVARGMFTPPPIDILDRPDVMDAVTHRHPVHVPFAGMHPPPPFVPAGVMKDAPAQQGNVSLQALHEFRKLKERGELN